MRKYIYILIFLLIITSVYSIQSNINFTETWNSASDQFFDTTDLPNVSINDLVSSSSFTADLGIYYVGQLDDVTPFPTGRINLSTKWNNQGKQVQSFMDNSQENPVLWTFFLDRLTIFNDTTFSYQMNTSGTPASYNLYTIFGNSTNDCSLLLTNAGSQDTTVNQRYCRKSTIPYSCTTNIGVSPGEIKQFNFSFGDGQECNGTADIENIDRMVFTSTGINSNIIFDNIVLNNVLNGSNALPTFNFSVNNAIACVPNEFDSVIFNFSINATDFENDTIYYAISTNPFNTSELVSFTKKTCNIEQFFCAAIPDFTFINRVIEDTKSCEINLEPVLLNYNTSKLNLVADFTSEYDIFFGFQELQAYLLELNGNCTAIDISATRRFSYVLPSPLIKPQIKQSFYNIDSNDNFELFLSDNTYEEIYSILFLSVNDTYMNIFNLNNSDGEIDFPIDWHLIGNISHNGFLNVEILAQSDGLNFDLNLVSEFESKSIRNLTNFFQQNKLIQIYGIDYTNVTFMRTSAFSYGGVAVKPDFSTLKPTSINISGVGKNFITLFVTDDKHLPNDFSIDTETIQILSNDMCIDTNNIFDQDDNLLEFQNKNNHTGILLLISKLIWFLQFPYRLFKSFGLVDTLQWAVTIFTIIGFFLRMINNNENFDLFHNLIFLSFMSGFFIIMKIFIIPVFVGIIFITSFYIARNYTSG